MARAKETSEYRDGSLGSYLTQAGWKSVPQEKNHPLWTKDNQTLTAYEAWMIEMRRIWRETHGRKKLAAMNKEQAA